MPQRHDKVGQAPLEPPKTLAPPQTAKQTQSCLVVDCSGQVISVAVARRGQGAWSQQLYQQHGQAEALASLAQDVIQRAGLESASDLDLIVVCRGPGGFTGLRVGVSFCLGLGAAVPHADLMSISTDKYWTFVCADKELETRQPVLCLVETRRSDFYWKNLSLPSSNWAIAADLEEWAQVQKVQNPGTLVGNAVEKALVQAPSGPVNHEIDCDLLAQKSLDCEFQQLYLESDLTPLYVRAPSISKPSTGVIHGR